tara:strand:+ start:2418 stop:3044 length:627 start_codon:yes stop_codon:yes gene_type:complete
MHKINVLIHGPDSFISTINELKPFLKFNLTNNFRLSENMEKADFDAMICHEIEYKKITKYINNFNKCLKILACSNSNMENKTIFDTILILPTSIDEINKIIEDEIAKRKFNINSSINVKSYTLDKNEKKLLKENIFVILTEKEIQLIELFLYSKKPISKNKILSSVWNYSSDADTHTVETHIYRLRKKINEKFLDSKFILNDKDGYYL